MTPLVVSTIWKMSRFLSTLSFPNQLYECYNLMSCYHRRQMMEVIPILHPHLTNYPHHHRWKPIGTASECTPIRSPILPYVPVLSQPWRLILWPNNIAIIHLILGIPVSNASDCILVFVDTFTTMCHLIPCSTSSTSPQFAKMLLDHVIRLHGIPNSIVSERGSILTSPFWKALSKFLNRDKR